MLYLLTLLVGNIFQAQVFHSFTFEPAKQLTVQKMLSKLKWS